MTRSTFIPPTFRALCVLLGILGVTSFTLARADDPQPLKTNTSLSAQQQASGASPPETNPTAQPAESPDDPISEARPLPPRSSRPVSTAETSRRTAISMPEGTWRTIGALGLVVGLIVLVRSVLRRFGGPLAKARAPSGIIEVLGRFPLVRGQTLLLIKVDRRILLLGQSPQGLTTLSELTDPEQVSSLVQRIANDRGDSFSRQFDRLITPVRSEKTLDDAASTIIDLTRGDKASAARRVASMLADGGRA